MGILAKEEHTHTCSLSLWGQHAQRVEHAVERLVEVFYLFVIGGFKIFPDVCHFKVFDGRPFLGIFLRAVTTRVLKQGEYLRILCDAALVGSLLHPYLAL